MATNSFREMFSLLRIGASGRWFLLAVLVGVVAGSGAITINDVYRKDSATVAIPESMTLADILQLLSQTRQHYFPVVNTDGRMVGIFSDADLFRNIYDETIGTLADAADIMVTPLSARHSAGRPELRAAEVYTPESG